MSSNYCGERKEAATITIPSSSNVPISIQGRSVTVTYPHDARVEITIGVVGEEGNLLSAQVSAGDGPYELCIVHKDPPPPPKTESLPAKPPINYGIPGAQAVPSIVSLSDASCDTTFNVEYDTVSEESTDVADSSNEHVKTGNKSGDISEQPRPEPETPQTMGEEKLLYENGWNRVLRQSEGKFYWDVDAATEQFDINKSSFVRKLEFRQGEDLRLRAGDLSLVPVAEGSVDSFLMGPYGRNVFTHKDIAEIKGKSFEERVDWFQRKCAELCVERIEGHMHISVRRRFLLEDSVHAVMSLARKDLHKQWRFEFIGEAAIDAGGSAREWFQLVTEEIFDPDMGLWQSSAMNQMCLQINPASAYCCDDHLIYYRFLGRVMGKALLDGQLVVGHMVQYIYKHILSFPVAFADLEQVDEEYHAALVQLADLAKAGDDISMLCLDFTTTQNILGHKEEIELVEGGANIEVDNANLPEYLEACLKYRLLECSKPQLSELLLGFFDVIPEPLLTIFDFKELELLMCGVSKIDVVDWMENTEYSGEFEGKGVDHPTCRNFWQIVNEFDEETRARLLQFVTGTSGLPAKGFGSLRGNDDNVQKFTLHGVHLNVCIYPRAHTTFNRLDLPTYYSKHELKEKLMLAVNMVVTGFDIE